MVMIKKGLIITVSALLILSALSFSAGYSENPSLKVKSTQSEVSDSLGHSFSTESNVTFAFNGIPSNTSLIIQVGNETYTSDLPVLNISIPNGNYTYAVINSRGYFSPEWTGVFDLNASGDYINVNYSGIIEPSTGIYLQNGSLYSNFNPDLADLNPQPLDAVFDPFNNNTYVISQSPMGFYDLNNDGGLAFHSTPQMPQDIALDTLTGNIVVAENSTIAVFTPLGLMVGEVSLPYLPNAIIYNNFTNTFWVGTDSSVIVLNASSLKAVNQINGLNIQIPGQLVLNTLNGSVYALNVSAELPGNQLLEYNENMQALLDINIPGFSGVAAFSGIYDRLYLTTISAGNDLFYLNGSELVSVDNYNNASSVQYLSNIHSMVVISDSGSVYLIDPVTQSLLYLMNPQTLPTLAIPGTGGSLSFISRNTGTFSTTAYFDQVKSFKIVETGLEGGQSWNATVDNYTQTTNSTSIQFFEPSGNYTLYVGSVSGYYSKNTYIVNLSNPVTLQVNFQKLYTVFINYINLPSRSFVNLTIGSYHLNSSNISTGDLALVNGTYNYSATTNGGGYLSPSTGVVVVHGKNVFLNITWTLHIYNVKIVETGLPGGSKWSVFLNNLEYSSDTSTLNLNLSYGTYFLFPESVPGYFPSSFNTSFNVRDSNLTLNVIYSPVVYNVSVNLNAYSGNYPINFLVDGVTYKEYNSSFSIMLPNGSYSYEIDFPGNTWKNLSGQFNVDSFPVSISLDASLNYYSITLHQTGLPEAILWGVSINGQEFNSTAPTFSFLLPNGTYTVTVNHVSGFVNILPFTLTVSGKNVSYTLEFQRILKLYSVNLILLGVPYGHKISVTIDNVTLNYSFNQQLQFDLTNGTYNMSLRVFNHNDRHTFGTYNLAFNVSGRNETLFVLVVSNKFAISFTIVYCNPLLNFVHPFNNYFCAPLFEQTNLFPNSFRGGHFNRNNNCKDFFPDNQRPIGWP